MLKVKQLQMLDKKNRLLCIDGHRIEKFPLQGGEEANMVSIKSWNQHGNTFDNAFMESFEGELDFIIPNFNKNAEGILCNRKAITSVCKWKRNNESDPKFRRCFSKRCNFCERPPFSYWV